MTESRVNRKAADPGGAANRVMVSLLNQESS